MITGAQALARTLDGYGVSHVFFVPSIVPATLAELEKTTAIERILVHDERAAAYMADGYARASGRPGICAAQMIGGSNLASGLRDTWQGCSPVIAITGGPYSDSRHRSKYQEIDNHIAFEPVTKYNEHVEHADHLSEILRQAFRTVTSGNPAPAHISLAGHFGEVFEAQETDQEVIVEERFSSVPAFRPEPDAESVHEMLKAIAAAERPILIAGGGVRASHAQAELLALAEKLSIPVATSLNAKDSFPPDHPLSVGVVGLYPRQSANWAVLEADLVCFIGSKTGSQVTTNWQVPAPGTPVIQVDIEPEELGRHYPNVVSVLGDAKVTLRRLTEAAEGSDRGAWVERTQAFRRHWESEVSAMADSDADPIRPERLCRDLGGLLPSDSLIVCDTGHNGMWAAAYLDFADPSQGFIRAAGSLGWAFPASMGAKLAQKDRPVFTFIGDGGLWYHLSELETAVRWNVNVNVILNNNRSLNEEVMVYEPAYGGELHGRHGELWMFEDVDFTAVARSVGATGLTVRKPAELASAMEQALSIDGPTVIDVRTDIEAMAGEGAIAVPAFG